MTSTPAATPMPATVSIVIPFPGPLLILPNCITTEHLGNYCDGIKKKKGETSAVTVENKLELKHAKQNNSLTNMAAAAAAAVVTPTTTTGNKQQRQQQQQQKQQRPDKSKGCPYPTCSRYGRAFSRAHDLKRHIARHETRKETRLFETSGGADIRTCCQCGESFFNDSILERHARLTHLVEPSIKQQQQQHEFPSLTFMPALSNDYQQLAGGERESSRHPLITYYSCNICKKKCTNEKKFKAHHLLTDDNKQKPENKVSQLCSCHNEKQVKNNEMSDQEEHTITTSTIFQVHKDLNSAKDKFKQVIKEDKAIDDDDGGGGGGGGDYDRDRDDDHHNHDAGDDDDDDDDDNDDDDDDDQFMLQEMLLLKKNPRIINDSSSGDNNAIAVTALNAPAAISSACSSSSAATTTTTTIITTPNNNNNNNNKIRCDYCSKTFKTKWTLSSHVAAHEGRFQFGCTRCGKKFVRKSHFEGHVRSHEAARPYVCQQCGKTFKEVKHRREHTKRKHHHPDNQNAIQNLLDSITACVSSAEDSSLDQTKFTLVMPINFAP